MRTAPPCLDDAIMLLADLGHDLASAHEFGFTLGQDDCWDCARAIQAVLLDYKRLEGDSAELQIAQPIGSSERQRAEGNAPGDTVKAEPHD